MKEIRLEGMIATTMCSCCDEWIPVDDFYSTESNISGITGCCIDCYKKKSNTKQIDQRAAGLWKRYRMRQADWDRMFAEQGFACKACKDTEPHGKKPWGVDHDHSCCPGNRSCGKCVRGILCYSCNWTLGQVKDSIKTLEGLIQYLIDAGVK